MTKFHAVMLDETRCEFGADVEADTREQALEMLREDYPESQCVQLESPSDTRRREAQMMDDINRGIERDDDGRITHIEPGYDEGPDDDDEDDYGEED
jgi:hypothetical protein